MTERGTCVVCSQPVTDATNCAWPVTGWEAERGQGGANQIVGRQRVLDGRVAHASCIRDAVRLGRHGIAPTQEQLL